MNNRKYLHIVSDGAIGTSNINDGKLIPVLILDCSNSPEFLNLIEIHQDTPPGDVQSKWGYFLLNPRFVQLELNFLNPVEVSVTIQFDLQKQSAIADAIVQAKSVYLQPSKYGNRVVEGLEKPKIIIEIPYQTKLKKWDEILVTNISKKLKKNGIPKKEAKKAAIQHLERMREIMRPKN